MSASAKRPGSPLLTVAAIVDDGFEVSLIPETLERTNLGSIAVGDAVNIELDVIARYVERLMSGLGGERSPDA